MDSGCRASGRKLATSGRFSAISFQKQRNSIFIKFTSGRSSLETFPHSNGTLEYSEILDIIRMCCYVIRTACRDIPNNVNFWNSTPCWTMIDQASRRCCSDVRTSSSFSVRHCGVSDFGRTLHGHLLEACDQLLSLIWTLSEYLKILNWKPTIMLICNYYIKCFCRPDRLFCLGFCKDSSWTSSRSLWSVTFFDLNIVWIHEDSELKTDHHVNLQPLHKVFLSSRI